MAEEKGTQKPKERVKYKFGQNNIDLTNYIHNLGTNVQSYLNSKNWNEGQKQEFMSAYNRYLTGLQEQLANNTNRFTTDDFGSIIDSTGALSNTDDDNIDPVGSEYYYDNKGNRITTDDFNALNKRKQKNYNTFSANREVATYFNTIGNALKGMETPKEKGQDAFDLSKHGFSADWTKTNNPAGGDFVYNPYWEMDKVNEETGVRDTSNRAAYLKEQIENYIQNIGDQDFSATPFKTRDAYIQRLQEAAVGLANGYNSEDTIALNRAGIGNEFLSKFFATGETTEGLKTEAQQASEYIKQQQQQEEDQKTIDLANRMKAMSELGQYIKDNPFKSKYQGFLDGGNYNAQSILQDIEENYSHIEGDDNKVKAWINFDQLLKDLRDPVIEGADPLRVYDWEATEKMAILRKNLAKKLKFAAKEGYMKSYGNDEYIIPGSEDYNNYSVMTYNPNTGEYKDQSIILNEKLREAMAYDWYKKNQAVQSNKNGGILSYLQEGGFMKRAREARQQRKQQEQSQQKVQQEQKQKQENKPKDDTRTPEQRKAGERVPKEGELSTADIARIGSAVADIGSVLAAFVPGYGTAASATMGLGSTLVNLYADTVDDSVSGWQAAGNAGFGLLMDTVGLIPGLGATGKAGKIAKTLKYVLPTALTIWGVSENGEDAIKAANKLMNGQDLTVDDWKALSFGLQTIVGGVRAARGNKSVNKQLESAREAVPYRTITAESGKTYKVKPEQFEQITSATTLDAQNKAFREAIGNSSESLGNKFKNSKWERIRHPFTSEPKTGEGVDYVSRNTDISTMERIPYQFKVDNGKLVPRKWSDEWILQKTGGRTFGDPSINLFTRKNPSYNKPTVPQQQLNFDKLRQLRSQTGELTPREIATINWQRVKQGKGRLTEQEIETLNQRRQNRASNSTDNSFKARLQRYKDAKRAKNSPSVEEDIKRAKDELAEATRQQRLAVPTGQGELISPDANQARSTMKLLHAVSAIRPIYLPAVRPKQQPRIGPAIFNYNGEFYPVKVVTTPLKLQLTPKTPRRPSQIQHDSRQRDYNKLFNAESTESPKGITKSPKGIAREERKREQRAQKAAQEYIETAKKMSKEKELAKKKELTKEPAKEKEPAKNTVRIKGELPHKQSNKKKKTSRDDRRTVRREDGGTLDLVKVRKFQNAGKFPEWYSKLYKFQNLTSWNNQLNQSLAGPSITNQNTGHYRAGDLNEAYTKNNSYTSNPNLVGQDLQSYYDSSFKGKSLDDYVNAYNANAAKIRGYWDQERTYKQSGAQEHNRLFKNMFGNRSDNSNNVWNIGYDSNLEDIVGSSTWLRRMDRYEKEFDKLSDEEKKSRIHKIDLGNGNYGYVYKKANGDIAVWNQPATSSTYTDPADSQTTSTITSVIPQESSNDNKQDKQDKSLFDNINPTILYGLPRAIAADRINRRITDLAKESVVPLLKDPFEVHRYTRSDLDAEMQGERDYANLRRLASRPLTSDGGLQTATQLQAEVQGQEARTAGKEKSNQVQRQYDELAWQQEKENAANRHETAMFNRAQQWGADQDKNKYEQAYLAKKFNIWDVLGQQLEYDARTKQNENKTLEDNFAKSDIHNAVSNSPNEYGANLTTEELTVWNKVLTGTNPSSLGDELNVYVRAMKKVSNAEQQQLGNYYNIPRTIWSRKTFSTPWSPTMSEAISAKNGAKITVAGIEAKTADAERFQKQIKECIDRNEKVIDRLSKSLYGLIKASITK